MSESKIVPCTGCKEICEKLERNISIYLGLMDWEQTKVDVWAFWRTLRSFVRHKDNIAILEYFYEISMSVTNKSKVSKGDFISYMTSSIA